MDQHYPPEYGPYASYDAVTSKRFITANLTRLAYRYGMYKRTRFVTNYKKSGRLLDVGCSTGIFLNHIQENLNKSDWEIFGVEVNHEAANAARLNFNLKVFTGTLEEANFPAAFFDAITLWDVLEHLHDPMSSLLEMCRILKVNGILVLRVPNLDSWWANLFGKYWAGLEPPRHLYVFNQTTLSSLLEKSGFHVLKTSTAISSYLVFVLSIRFWLVGKSIKPAYRNSILRMMYHPITRALTAPLFFIDTMFKKGSALVVVAEKQKTRINE
jgi:SAM-dependent methyltransferase